MRWWKGSDALGGGGQPALAAIVLVSLAACLAGVTNSFVHDDAALLLEDYRLHDPGQWPRLLTEAYWPPPYAPDQYRPLTSLALSMQYIIGGGSPAVFRLVSALLYAACGLVVFRLVRTLLHSEDAALLAALLFVAHPVHVEATALAVGQAELLMTLQTVTAVACYVRWRREGRMTRWRWAGLLALYAGAALSKEQGLLVPAFLVAAELTMFSGGWRQRLHMARSGYLALAAAALGLAAMRVAVLGAREATNVAEALRDLSLPQRALTALQLVPHWIRLLVWPAHLRMDYSPAEFRASHHLGVVEAAGAGILVIAIAVAWTCRRRFPAVTMGIALGVLAVLPVSNVLVPTGVLIAERTLFLPSVGIVLVVAGLANGMLRGSIGWRVTVASVFALVALGTARSVERQLTWRSQETLTLAAIEDSPGSWRANANHADLLFRSGRVAEARRAYERALGAAPAPWFVRHAYARRLRESGDDEQALVQLGISLAEFPDDLDAVRDVVAVLITLGRYEEAMGISNQVIARGRPPTDLVRLWYLADSARSARAPAGAVRVPTLSAEREIR